MAQKLKPLSFQPIPYQGSKRKLAPSIAGFIPQQARTLYEPFAGSAALTLYAALMPHTTGWPGASFWATATCRSWTSGAFFFTLPPP